MKRTPTLPWLPVRRLPGRWLPSLALLAFLAACGAALGLGACGGGGAGGGGPGKPPGAPASRTHVVVDVSDPGDLEDLEDETGAVVEGPIEGTSYYLVRLPEGVDADEFLEDLDDDVRVVDAERDEGVEFPEGGGSTIPVFTDDPFGKVGIQTELVRIGAPAAQSRVRGAGVLVAVVDTGVDAAHPLLAGRVAPGGWDFVGNDADPSDVGNGIDDDGDGLVDEGVGHGTFVASLILAVAPEARILPVRALGSDATGTASTVARAIGWAVSRGADVINLSAGLPEDLDLIEDAVENARQAGVPVVAAAGNRNASVDFPAFLSDAAAVTALDRLDRKASFASFGSSVDLSAPGVDLYGAHPRSPSGVARWSGTSFSTALVSGGVALLREALPAAGGHDLVRRLEDTSVPIDAANPTFGGRLGRGRIDLDAATAGAGP